MPGYPLELPDLIRLELEPEAGDVPAAALVFEDGEGGWFQLGNSTFEVRSPAIRSLLGDVLLVNRDRGYGDRVLRRKSEHNTLLITERCDQLCVMCSQPPKDYELDLFGEYRRALPYAAPSAVIGISGGEPLLYKNQVFELIRSTATSRPDLGFHILTNAQHLTPEDKSLLADLPSGRVKFAVPLYAAEPNLHDQIVGKVGAFESAIDGITVLMESGVEVEIRTVIMKQNADGLVDLARFLAWNMPDIDHWAVMQLEYIGFAKKNWDSIFFDHSVNCDPLLRAIGAAEQHGVRGVLYNMPLCTLPEQLRHLAPPTISDWKKKLFDQCANCGASSGCSGFFAWQPFEKTYEKLGPICDLS
ncbi:His-Xaa-Ser system radical SAM maturase HxsC [Pseudooceanicola nitratireducens]